MSRGSNAPPQKRGNGRGPGRRAMMRWASRMFIREWRQQVLVLALLTLAVAAAIGLASAAYNVAPVSGNAEFGTANHYFEFKQPDPATLPGKFAAAKEWFGAIDPIGHRLVPIPGSVETVDYRAQDPEGPFGGPMLALTNGHYPASDGEIAVTDGVAQTFDLEIGATFALDGAARTVVGVVENPSDLGDEFGLVTPSAVTSSDSVILLVDASEDRVGSFRPPGDTSRIVASRGGIDAGVFAAVGVLAVATVALILVALVAAASFIVVAQRRQRQLGMLAAVGATERQVRLVVVTNGALTGALGAILGAVLGMVGWIASAPYVEHAVGYRIDAFNVPWWLIVTGMLLAVIAATAAAWWPARTVARVPTVVALSGRPPRPTPVHRSATLAASLIAAGVACLAIAGDVADEVTVHWANVVLVAAGTVATVLGILLVSPLAIRALARSAARLPIAVRLAVRDLGRYQARSSAALAAISLVLGIPVTIIIIAAAAVNPADAGNLSDHQLIVRAAAFDGPFVPVPADLEGLRAGIDELAASLPEPTVISLDAALDPAARPDPNFPGRPAISLAERVEGGYRDLTVLYVATPELVGLLAVDLHNLGQGSDIVTRELGDLRILGASALPGSDRSKSEVVTNPGSLPTTYTSLPGSFITPASVAARGWEAVPSGRWLIEASEPLSNQELANAREIAAGAGLRIETRDHQEGLRTVRGGATIVGMALALGVLALTVGLMRGESAGDVRTLTATGATSSTRRALTAATAGGLALLGVILGTIGAYLALAASHLDKLAELTPVPIVQLLIMAVGTPLIAAGAGWLLTGREPTALAQQRID
jgi:putative ABC transport system permease protein